jgi:tRNA(Arg) A34 adenosine deaminase TadA
MKRAQPTIRRLTRKSSQYAGPGRGSVVWLTECVLYSSAEPCPMCLAAALWARIDKVFFGNGSEATENVGFIDRRILEELKRPRQERTMPSEQLLADEAGLAIQEWQDAKVKRNRPEFT